MCSDKCSLQHALPCRRRRWGPTAREHGLVHCLFYEQYREQQWPRFQSNGMHGRLTDDSVIDGLFPHARRNMQRRSARLPERKLKFDIGRQELSWLESSVGFFSLRRTIACFNLSGKTPSVIEVLHINAIVSVKSGRASSLHQPGWRWIQLTVHRVKVAGPDPTWSAVISLLNKQYQCHDRYQYKTKKPKSRIAYSVRFSHSGISSISNISLYSVTTKIHNTMLIPLIVSFVCG